jgi:hypothetical protein
MCMVYHTSGTGEFSATRGGDDGNSGGVYRIGDFLSPILVPMMVQVTCLHFIIYYLED